MGVVSACVDVRGRLLHGNVCVIISRSVRMGGRRCGSMGASACVGVGGKLRARQHYWAFGIWQ